MGGEERSFLKALGPGLLWAGAAVGVSHLVQSTRAGASFGLGLVVVVLAANFFKYPAFQFGPRYAAATGTSLLEGYRRQGRWALVLYAVLTAGTMFTVQAVVTLVTAALFAALLGWSSPFLGLPAPFWLAVLLLGLCAGLLLVGRYRWLDRLNKVVVLVLTLTTVAATLLVLPKVPWRSIPLLPDASAFTDPRSVAFLVALVGWMPSAFDISIWHSLWTLARREQTGHAPRVKEAVLDFDIGYLGTVLLALCFVLLGAGVMYGSGEAFDDRAAAFAQQVIALYTRNLGAWAAPLIGLAAGTVMFSTTLTVADGFPRALSGLAARFRGPERPGEATVRDRAYWGALLVLAAGSLAIIGYALRGGAAFKALVDLATSLSFLTAPALAWLNHRAIHAAEVPAEHRPSRALTAWSVSGILFSTAFAAWYLKVLAG
ncbi:MAG TPA: divalent metal cation transporter [Thermoanaerobaculia bacterium]|nr:divalent metal cation transporter [Thermoanaerobaculia bacterium]